MQFYVLIILISLCISSVQAQNWLGTYTTDSSCSTGSCCCVSGRVVVTTVSTGFTGFTTGLTGTLCSGASSYSTNMTTPTTYVTSLSISGITLTFTLSSNSLMINVVSSLGSSCGGNLTKISTSTTTNSSALSWIHDQFQAKTRLLHTMTFLGLIRHAWLP